MNVNDLKAGQRITFTLSGVVKYPAAAHSDSEYVGISVDYGEGQSLYKNFRKTALKNIKLSDPENWPPVLGDIWEANGTEYIVLKTSSTLMIQPVEDKGRCYGDYYEAGFDAFTALNPKLIRRREKK